MKHYTPLFLFLSLVACILPVCAQGIPEGYYTAADGKKKVALKAALHDIIRPLKANEKSYGSGSNSTWSGFYVTDRIEKTNQVIDRYSYDVRYFSQSDNANYASAISGMNIEHSFPKSWWGGSKNEAYMDLFNLMPCEAGINSSKSNYPMGKVTSVKTTNGCTKVGTGPAGSKSTSLWEPADEWKGDFARDYFYMVTAYSDLTWTSAGVNMLEQNSWPTLQKWAYELFLQWAREDPVDDMERKRNDAVYSIQKNRNPFIDFPNLAEYIWGDSVDYAFSISTSSTGGNDTDEPTPDFATLVDVSLKDGLSPFFVRTYDGQEGEVWKSTSQYGAVANAYSITGKEADEYLMVNLDLSMMEDAVLTFSHATGYNKTVPVKDSYFQVLVSENYDGVPEDATWQKLDATFPSLPGNISFTQFVASGNVSLARYSGYNITLAFRYTSNSAACYCWEIKDVKVTAYEYPDALPLIAEDEPDIVFGQDTYDLSGRRVPHDTKGIVIRGGRKLLNR